VIMIGEIRDLETAQIAIQASLTGHLVLATLHTNDAQQRGDPPDRHGRGALPAQFVSLLGVLAQRLVRKLCLQRAMDAWPLAPGRLRACSHSGYKGRTGVYELMVADDAIRAADPQPRAAAGRACRAAAAGRRHDADARRRASAWWPAGMTTRRGTAARARAGRRRRDISPMPAYPFEALERRRQAQQAACSKPTTPRPRERSCAPRRWCRWT